MHKQQQAVAALGLIEYFSVSVWTQAVEIWMKAAQTGLAL